MTKPVTDELDQARDAYHETIRNARNARDETPKAVLDKKDAATKKREKALRKVRDGLPLASPSSTNKGGFYRRRLGSNLRTTLRNIPVRGPNGLARARTRVSNACPSSLSLTDPKVTIGSDLRFYGCMGGNRIGTSGFMTPRNPKAQNRLREAVAQT